MPHSDMWDNQRCNQDWNAIKNSQSQLIRGNRFKKDASPAGMTNPQMNSESISKGDKIQNLGTLWNFIDRHIARRGPRRSAWQSVSPRYLDWRAKIFHCEGRTRPPDDDCAGLRQWDSRGTKLSLSSAVSHCVLLCSTAMWSELELCWIGGEQSKDVRLKCSKHSCTRGSFRGSLLTQSRKIFDKNGNKIEKTAFIVLTGPLPVSDIANVSLSQYSLE